MSYNQAYNSVSATWNNLSTNIILILFVVVQLEKVLASLREKEFFK